MKYTIAICLLLLCVTPQTSRASMPEGDESDTSIPKLGFIFGASYASPLGVRFIGGLEASRWIALCIQYSMNDTWSKEKKGKFGYAVILSLPLKESNFSPTLELGVGSDNYRGDNGLTSCDATSDYWYASLGMRYYLTRHIFLSGALGYAETNAYQSGGCKSWNSETPPRIDVQGQHFTASVGIAITGIDFGLSPR